MASISGENGIPPGLRCRRVKPFKNSGIRRPNSVEGMSGNFSESTVPWPEANSERAVPDLLFSSQPSHEGVGMFTRMSRESTTNPVRDIRWLISPMEYSTFLETYWTKTPARIARGDPSFYRSLLSEADLEYALFSANKEPGSVKILNSRQPFQNADMYGDVRIAYRAGCSIRIDGIQRFSHTLILLARAIEQELSCPIGINMYLTPGKLGAKALPRHYDTHDVFVLQVHGKKRWRIYAPPVPFPLEYRSEER